MMKTTTTAYDANGFPIRLSDPVTFSLEESSEWYCKVCQDDSNGDVDDAGHRYDDETLAEQIWTACPLEGDGDGDVYTGSFADALAYFTSTFKDET